MNRSEVRGELAELAQRLLLGPMDELECLTSNPSDTYLTGILWPMGSGMPEEEDDANAGEVASGDYDEVEKAVPGYRAIRPCSIGLTCSVDAGVPIDIDLEATARYVPLARDPAEPPVPDEPCPLSDEQSPDTGDHGKGEMGSSRVPTDWHRCAVRYRLRIEPTETRTKWQEHEFLLPDGSSNPDPGLTIDIRRRPGNGIVVLTATLINTARVPESGGRRDDVLLFQSRLRVSAVAEDGTPGIRPRTTRPLADDEDALTNLLIYRDVQEFAIGHGVSAEWPRVIGEAVPWVATSWMPRSAVPGTSAEGHRSLARLRSAERNPFAAEWMADETSRSDGCDALDAFCDAYEVWIRTSLETCVGSFPRPQEQAAQANLKRCRDTLSRMRRGVTVLRQSDTAWTAFALANRAMDAQSRFPSKGANARPLVWRPFQLAFLLLVVPSVADGNDPDRGTMDLLWFPTGGGKTEAYLGLTAFQIFLRRLEDPERRVSGGVDVLMRYTLRLLTVQQFQRAAALICACDRIRSEDPVRLGSAPVSLGLYVGEGTTPNRLADAVAKIEEERNGQRPKSTPRQLLKCPVCGGDLPPAAHDAPQASGRLDIRCPSTTCPTAGKPLPVMTVDDLIYRDPPSLLIGTIDKFAQLPRRTDIRRVFGLDSALRPGLIIQDELHLISGPLGSMTGLYEAAIDLICTSGGVRPKIVGSTATIGRAARQVRALFDRDVLQFPPPGFDAADSFFAVRDEAGPDRLYLGISSAGRSPKFALQAVIAALLQGASALREGGRAADAEIDPYWTCVGYFNSLRELGGAHVLMLDDVPRQMQFLARRLGLLQRPIQTPPEELSSRIASRDIPEALLKLETSLAGDDIFAPEPVNAVLASNMISVGVDISRLGLMVVNGQPKSTAEYIQATSRVGRGMPGLVVTIYNFGRPRDVSHLEHFSSYHDALYRSVEATSVTPWAPRARDKALHAVFIAMARHLIPGLLEDDDAIAFDETDPQVDAIVSYLVRRARAASGGLEDGDTADDLEEIVKTWVRRACDSTASGKKLRYWERRAPFGRSLPHLMRSSEEMKGQESVAWPTPNSMREVEPSTAFALKRIRRQTGGTNGEG